MNNHNDLNYPIFPEKIHDFKQANILEKVTFFDAAIFNNPIYLRNYYTIEHLLISIKDEYHTRKKYFLTKISCMLTSLLIDIYRFSNMYKDSNRNLSNKGTIDVLIQYIHNNYNLPITNKKIGLHFNYHPNYLNKLMIQHTGTSLHQYIINYRISHAINLLKSSDNNIKEISHLAGFKDINHFSKCFKKKVGFSPKYFKNKSHTSI
jgi:AraC-like DNA-binding protein